jgi:hypothetical protein
MIKFILARLLNNANVIALIIYAGELTSLILKSNIDSGYLNEKLDFQTDIRYTRKSVNWVSKKKKKIFQRK